MPHLRSSPRRTLQRIGLGLMASASLLMASTTLLTPGATADDTATTTATTTATATAIDSAATDSAAIDSAATAAPVRIFSWQTDGLAKKDTLSDLDMLVQKEVQLPDGSFSDGDPAAAQTTPVDAISTLYPKQYDVKQAGIPTVLQGGSATFRIRVYPRRMDNQTYGASLVTIIDTTDAPGTPGVPCSQTTPISVPASYGLEYTCTLTGLAAKPGSTEDLINTIRVISTDVNGANLMERTEQAAVNVEPPAPTSTTLAPLSGCLTVKKYARRAGTVPFFDAQAPNDPDVPSIAPGGTAEYRIVVANGCNAPVSNVTVTDDDTTAACGKTIGTMAPSGSVAYTSSTIEVTNDPALAAVLVTAAPGCVSTNVGAARTSTARVTGTGPSSEQLTASDPVNIKIDLPITVPPTTLPPTTLPPTTLPPTTLPPTTLPPTTLPPTTLPPPTAVPTTPPPTTVAAVSILGVQVPDPTTTTSLAVTGSDRSRPILLAGLLVFLIGAAMLLASRTVPEGRRDRPAAPTGQ